MAGGWQRTSNGFAVPLTRLQIDALRVLASRRSPDSYVAGGVAINSNGPRYSNDIDIFQDSLERLETAATADAEALIEAGFEFKWTRILTGKREAEIGGGGDQMRLDWVHDSAFRFFPAQPDDLFGYVLHPADLATNKVSAAADRREPRDVLDLLTLNDRILPLGAAICAAVGRFPGQTPEEMLADIRRHSRFTMEEFQSLATEAPLEMREISRSIGAMLDGAESFIRLIPSEAIGVLFLQNGIPVEPNLQELSKYERRSGSEAGVWPSSSEISREMLYRYESFDQGRPPGTAGS
jgi:hypothetical protein